MLSTLYKYYLSSGSVSIDSRNIVPGALFFAIRGARYNGNRFAQEALDKGARYAIIDDPAYRGASSAYILVENSQAILEALAQYHRLQYGSTFPVIAIAGSFGKTTTKALLNQVLSTVYKTVATPGNLNTSIGVALTLLSMDSTTQMAIIEMGASQKGDIALCCRIAQPTHGLITAIGYAHLKGFGSIEGVLQGKGELYDYLYKTHGVAFVNTMDPLLKRISQRFITPYTYPQCTDYYPLTLVEQRPYLCCKTASGKVLNTKLLGAHQHYNLAAALCVAKYFHIPEPLAYKAMEAYVPSDHRMELVHQGSNQIIIDSYNASPDSMKAALLALLQLQVNYRIVLLGDMADLGQQAIFWHRQLLEQLRDKRYDLVLVCGPIFSETLANYPHAKMHGFIDKTALANYLVHQRFENSGLLLKGSHHMAMHTLMGVIV